jgi:hypothetical protein
MSIETFIAWFVRVELYLECKNSDRIETELMIKLREEILNNKNNQCAQINLDNREST